MSFRSFNQYPIGFVALCDCSWRMKYPARTLQKSLFTVMRPFEFEGSKTKGEKGAFFSVFKEFNFSLLSVPKVDGWYLRSLWVWAAAIRAKFEKKRLNTLHNPRNNLSLVKLVGSCSPRIASFLCNTISKPFECMKWRLCENFSLL